MVLHAKACTKQTHLKSPVSVLQVKAWQKISSKWHSHEHRQWDSNTQLMHCLRACQRLDNHAVIVAIRTNEKFSKKIEGTMHQGQMLDVTCFDYPPRMECHGRHHCVGEIARGCWGTKSHHVEQLLHFHNFYYAFGGVRIPKEKKIPDHPNCSDASQYHLPRTPAKLKDTFPLGTLLFSILMAEFNSHLTCN